jgi:hypothetical protein
LFPWKYLSKHVTILSLVVLYVNAFFSLTCILFYLLQKFVLLYSSPSVIRMINSRRMRWAGHVARMEKMNANRILVGKPEGRLLGRPRRRWVDNIKMNLRETG